MKHLTEQWWSWCGDNDLSLSVNKTQELIVDTTKDEHAPLQIKSLTVERVSSTKFLVVYIREALLWNSTPHAWPRRLGRGCTYLRCWSHTHTRSHTHKYIYTILTIFYWSTIESILMSCMVTDTKILQCVVRMVEGVNRISLGNQFQGSMQEESSLHHERLFKGRSRTV